MAVPAPRWPRLLPQTWRTIALFVLLSAALGLPLGYSVATRRVETDVLIAITLLAEVVAAIVFVELFRSEARRRRIESELLDSHERLRTFIEALPDAVILKDGESRWRTINGPAMRLFRLQNM